MSPTLRKAFLAFALLTVAVAMRLHAALESTGASGEAAQLGASDASVANASDTQPRPCSCPPRGAVPSYEVFPNSSLALNTLVSRMGCAGASIDCKDPAWMTKEPFLVRSVGNVLQQIAVWIGDHDGQGTLRAIQVKFFDDPADYVVGRRPREDGPFATPEKQLEFEPGETLRGQVSIYADNAICGIQFTTSSGRTFQVGCTSTGRKYDFSSGNSFIAAFSGRLATRTFRKQPWLPEETDTRITVLSLGFWKPIRDLKFEDIEYPSLPPRRNLASPKQVAARLYCNSNDHARPFAVLSERVSLTVANEACFTSASTQQYGASVQISAGVPSLIEASGSARWDTASATETSNCQSDSATREQTIEFPSVTLEPRTRTRYSFMQWDGRLRGEAFRATLVVTFTDGTSWSRKGATGTFDAHSMTDMQEGWLEEEHNITSC